MARKRKKPQWVREDQPDQVQERAPRESRTQRKKAAESLDVLAEALLSLPVHQVDALTLSAELVEAIQHGRRITRHEARRRQVQFIGKLLRSCDHASITEAIASPPGRQADRAASRWLKRILEAGDAAIDAFIEQNPTADRQRLRQLCRKVRKDPESEGRLLSCIRQAL